MAKAVLVLKWACGIAGTVWLGSFGASWLLSPVPPSLRDFTLVAFAVFVALFLAVWVAALLGGEFTDHLSRSRGRSVGSSADEPGSADAREGRRPAYVFAFWWFGLTLMAWGALQSFFPVGNVSARDLVMDGRARTELVAAIAIGWVVTRLLTAAADRGWVD